MGQWWLHSDRFYRYAAIHKFVEIETIQGVHIESPNTIIEEWPTRLKCQTSQQGAREEFFALLGSNLSGLERYVEWKRVWCGTNNPCTQQALRGRECGQNSEYTIQM